MFLTEIAWVIRSVGLVGSESPFARLRSLTAMGQNLRRPFFGMRRPPYCSLFYKVWVLGCWPAGYSQSIYVFVSKSMHLNPCKNEAFRIREYSLQLCRANLLASQGRLEPTANRVPSKRSRSSSKHTAQGGLWCFLYGWHCWFFPYMETWRNTPSKHHLALSPKASLLRRKVSNKISTSSLEAERDSKAKSL